MAVAKRFTATTASVAAPIGGWNARDSVAEMNPLDAVVLNNFFPTPSQIQLRKGYTQYATGITGQVDTLMQYSGGSSSKMFAAAGSTIYDVSTAGAATSVVTGQGSDRLQYVNASTAGGNFLTAVNGTDAALIYDGTTWVKYSNISTAQTISNLTSSGTTCTLVTSVAHGLVTGNQVTITGASPAAYNGTFRITVTNGTTFTYTALSAPATSPASPLGSYTVAKFITGVDSSNLIGINLHKPFFTASCIFSNDCFFSIPKVNPDSPLNQSPTGCPPPRRGARHGAADRGDDDESIFLRQQPACLPLARLRASSALVRKSARAPGPCFDRCGTRSGRPEDQP